MRLLRALAATALVFFTLLAALDLMLEQRVAFPDAFVAVSARQADEPVCTFDRGFNRLGVDIISS